jgi:hypothetical protein
MPTPEAKLCLTANAGRIVLGSPIHAVDGRSVASLVTASF